MYVILSAPEITDFPNGFISFWAKSIFVGSISSNYQINALASTYIRLVEAALIEYQLGTIKLQEFWDDNKSINMSAVNRSISHYESCISNMHRATNCYLRLRKHRNPDALCMTLKIEKPSFTTDAVSNQIRIFRNEIHHLEQMVIDGRFVEGDPIALKPDGPVTPHPTEFDQSIKTIDRLVIGQRELLFSNLTIWLKEMGYCAQKISNFNPT